MVDLDEYARVEVATVFEIHDFADDIAAALQDSWVELESVVNENIYENLQKALRGAENIIRAVEKLLGGADALSELYDAWCSRKENKMVR